MVLLVTALSNVVVRGAEPKSPPEVAKPDFQQLIVIVEPAGLSSQGQVEQLRFERTGKCWYKTDGSRATGVGEARSGAVCDHMLSQGRIRRLNRLLEETNGLTATGGEGRATQTHPARIRITLKKDGMERTVVCEG
jgi:hypothetical protein